MSKVGCSNLDLEECQFWDVNRFLLRKRKETGSWANKFGKVRVEQTESSWTDIASTPSSHVAISAPCLVAFSALPFSKRNFNYMPPFYDFILLLSLCWNFLGSEKKDLFPILIVSYLKYPHKIPLFTRSPFLAHMKVFFPVLSSSNSASSSSRKFVSWSQI